MKSTIKNRQSQIGFTLIELLVVVTIIVVLLALLSPALNTAIYQAELTVCSAQLRTIGMQVSNYTADFKRFYPVRLGPRDPSPTALIPWKPNNVYMGRAEHDLRPLLRPYMDINRTLRDPLGPGETDFETQLAATWIEVDYNLWFGWQYLTYMANTTQKGMFKVGDRFEWAGRDYRVLASDTDTDRAPNYDALCSHADRDGVLQAIVLQPGESIITKTHWENYNGAPRGNVDANYAFTDLSVDRLYDLPMGAERQGVTPVPVFSIGNDNPNEFKEYLPR